eukprot:2228277-Karenia_brevis.AAC.1
MLGMATTRRSKAVAEARDMEVEFKMKEMGHEVRHRNLREVVEVFQEGYGDEDFTMPEAVKAGPVLISA